MPRRRKIIRILLGFIGVLLLFFGLYGLWVRVQMGLNTSLHSGMVQSDPLTGRLIFPQTALFYGLLAGFFLFITVILVGVIYRLVKAEQSAPGDRE